MPTARITAKVSLALRSSPPAKKRRIMTADAPRRPRRRPRSSSEQAWPSRLHRAALQGKQPARAFLDEEDDENQDQDLAEHGAGEGLQQLVGDAEGQRADQRAPEIADPAED